MGRERSPERDKAFEIWFEAKINGEDIKPKGIAEMLDIPPSKVRKWKSLDKWEQKWKNHGKHGAPFGSQNAKGNKGGPGGPYGNKKAKKHGLYEKVIYENLEDKDREMFDLAGKIKGLENDLQLARFKVAKLVEQQEKQKLKGTALTKTGTRAYKLKDDFYEDAINKGLQLVNRIEKNLQAAKIERDKLKLARERLELDKSNKGLGNDGKNKKLEDFFGE